jgi:signal transduction histidine kinase
MTRWFHTLTAKGVFVIFILTAVQTTALSSYEFLLARAERLVEIEANDKSFASQLNWLSTLSAVYALLTIDSSCGGQSKYGRGALHKCASQMLFAVDVLAPLLTHIQTEKLRAQVTSLIGECKRTLNLMETNSSLTFKQIANQSNISAQLEQLAQLRLNLILENRGRYPLTRDLLPKTRVELRRIIYVLFALNVGSGTILTLLFMRGICKRLALLEDNMNRFERGEALTEGKAGFDEISRLEQHFCQMAHRVEESAKEKQELLSMVSHDLRTPLTSVQGILTLLALERLEPLGAESKQLVERAERNLGRTITLINDLLQIERLSSGAFALDTGPVAISDLQETCLECVQDLAEQRNIKIALGKTDAIVQADKERITQVLMNLLSNAIKFSPDGETIDLKTEEHSDSIEIKVIDRGRGIPDDKKELIFERFKQVSKEDGAKNKGSGLGLAIARALILKHGGKIGVLDTPGGGSTFWFSLPKGGVTATIQTQESDII